jgi:hypothetical protein
MPVDAAQNPLLAHVWLLGAPLFWVHIGIGRWRLRPLIARGALTAAQANRFCWGAAVTVLVVAVAFEVAGALSGLAPMCQLSLPLGDPRQRPMYAVTLLLGAAFLYWVWKRGGDRQLALIGATFFQGGRGDKTFTPGQVRFAMTALIVLSWGGYVVMRLAMPDPPPFPGCGP